jgi:hypothetical protein
MDFATTAVLSSLILILVFSSVVLGFAFPIQWKLQEVGHHDAAIIFAMATASLSLLVGIAGLVWLCFMLIDEKGTAGFDRWWRTIPLTTLVLATLWVGVAVVTGRKSHQALDIVLSASQQIVTNVTTTPNSAANVASALIICEHIYKVHTTTLKRYEICPMLDHLFKTTLLEAVFFGLLVVSSLAVFVATLLPGVNEEEKENEDENEKDSFSDSLPSPCCMVNPQKKQTPNGPV